MRLLLDTHILLWAVASAASLWKIAIKTELRRADFQVELPTLRAVLPEMAIEELPVTGRHTESRPSTRTLSTAS